MRLIVGLGNIGEKYDGTNHNAGFMVLDKFRQKYGVKFSKNLCDSLLAETNICGNKVIFAKPTTFMNSSGLAIKSLVKKFNVDLSDLLVICDDIDIAPGRVRIRKSGSAGTHNGLKSVIGELQSENFARLRVGIGKPEKIDLIEFVLAKMNMTKEQESGIERAFEAAEQFALGEDIEKIMTRFNGDSNGTNKNIRI